MTSCSGGDSEARITLADVDASLEPVSPYEIQDEGAGFVEAQLPVVADEEAASAPRAVAEGGAIGDGTPRVAPYAFDPWFNDRAPMTATEIVVACVIVPVRVAVCVGVAAAVLPLSITLLAIYAALPQARRDTPSLRALVVWPIRILCRVALLGGGFWWIDTRGRLEPHRCGANIIVANHASVADVLYAVWAFAPAFLAKTEALRIPYVGAAARALGCVFVDRNDAASRAGARAAIAQWATVKSDGENGAAAPALLIFPEGTTTNGLCLISWERGAFAPGRPVLPVAISYPKGQPKPDALFSIETLRTIAKPWCRMHVTYLPPYVADAVEACSPGRFAADVRACVARALDVPVSQLTYRDGLYRKRHEGPAPKRGDGNPQVDAAATAAAMRRALSPLPWR